MIRLEPGTVPCNGLPVRRNYVYRGSGEDTLTGFMDAKAAEAPAEAAPAEVPADEADDWQPGQWRNVYPCGTPAALRRHRRRKEPLDFACRVAAAAESAAVRARKREATLAQEQEGDAVKQLRLQQVTSEYYGRTA